MAAGSPPGLSPPSLRRLLLKRSLQLKLQHHKSGTPLTQEGKELGPRSPNLGGEWRRVEVGCLRVRGGSDFIDKGLPSVRSSSP